MLPFPYREDNRGDYSDWMIAKMWVRVADANVHQLSVHFLGTYLLLEPIGLCCFFICLLSAFASTKLTWTIVSLSN